MAVQAQARCDGPNCTMRVDLPPEDRGAPPRGWFMAIRVEQREPDEDNDHIAWFCTAVCAVDWITWKNAQPLAEPLPVDEAEVGMAYPGFPDPLQALLGGRRRWR